MGTAQIAKCINGKELYQKRARKALPLLVRQAHSKQPITYSDLAAELGMPNPRNLNYVLDCIGNTLSVLAEQWGEEIPKIQALVVNKATGIPGCGFVGLLQLKNKDVANSSSTQKNKMIRKEWANIFAYANWEKILDELNLDHAPESLSSIMESVVQSVQHAGFGGGEGKAHRALKEYIAQHPELLQLDTDFSKVETEKALISGDFLDVSFWKIDSSNTITWVAVEIKSSISQQNDIVRGLFQCVKYKTIMDAFAMANEKKQNSRVILLLEGKFPNTLMQLQRKLDVEVVDCISPN